MDTFTQYMSNGHMWYSYTHTYQPIYTYMYQRSPFMCTSTHTLTQCWRLHLTCASTVTHTHTYHPSHPHTYTYYPSHTHTHTPSIPHTLTHTYNHHPSHLYTHTPLLFLTPSHPHMCKLTVKIWSPKRMPAIAAGEPLPTKQTKTPLFTW